MSDFMFYLNFILHWASILFYLFAGANLLRIRKDIDNGHLVIFLSGTFIMSVSLISVYDHLEQRTVFWALGHIICAYTFFYISKNFKNTYFTFLSQVTGSYNKATKNVMEAFGDSELLMVTKKSLDEMPLGEVFVLNDKVQFEKKSDPFGITFFETRMMSGGKFGTHQHDCIETCVVDQGCLVCPSITGKKEFTKNESVTFLSGWPHSPYAKEFTRLRVYFHEDGDVNK